MRMKKLSWKTAFSLAVLFHLLISAALCSSEWNQPRKTELPKKPIEVELGIYAEPMIKDEARMTIPSSVEEVGQTSFNEHDQQAGQNIESDVSQNNQGIVAAKVSVETATVIAGRGAASSSASDTVKGSSGAGSSDNASFGTGLSNKKSSGNGTGTGTGKTAKVAVLYGPAPDYPMEARSEGWEGTVRVRVLVAEDGSVGDAVVIGSSGHDCMDVAALAGIQRWRFSPAYRDGEAVTVWVVVPVVFDLR